MTDNWSKPTQYRGYPYIELGAVALIVTGITLIALWVTA